MRSFLSVLGIIIGVASVIAITSLGRSATMTIQDEIAKAGLGTIVLIPRPGTDPTLIRLFTPSLADRIVNEVTGVKAVVPLNRKPTIVKFGGREKKISIMATTEDLPLIFDTPLEEGRFFSSLDRLKRRAVAVIGSEIAAELFPLDSALDKRVRLYLDPVRSFEVVGVLESRADVMGVTFNTSIFVPFDTYATRIAVADRVERYAVGVTDGTDVLNVADRIDTYFFYLTGKQYTVRVNSPSTVAEMFEAVTMTLNAFLTGIAAISLLVGGIGIMNIMLVSVTERTREIGIRKAVGASPGAILGQFITEAVTLSIIGGIFGMIVGTGLSAFGTWLFGWNYDPNPAAYPLSMLFASSVGIFFGLYPAVRASRLKPVDALNYE